MESHSGSESMVLGLVVGLTKLGRGIQTVVQVATHSEGRPLRTGRGRLVLPDFEHPPASPGAEAWIEAARHEYSSVTSFEDLAAALTAVDAPRSLVDRVDGAAADERRHHRICLSIADRLGAAEIGDDPGFAARASRNRRLPELDEIAVSALCDGVLGEGFAAARLERAGRSAAVAGWDILNLATDERQHAQLAADIVVWCLDRDRGLGPRLRRALNCQPPVPGVPRHVARIRDEDRAAAGLCRDHEIIGAWQDALAAAEAAVPSK